MHNLSIPSRMHLIVCSTILILVGTSNNACAQGDGQPLPFDGMLINALIDKKVRAELDLIPEQESQIQELSKELRKQRSDLAKELKKFSAMAVVEREIELKRREYSDQFEEFKEQAHQRAMDVLLPHQVKRLKQVTAQLMIKRVAKQKKVSAGVLAPQVVEYLEIDDEQARRIEAKAREIQERLAAEMKRLREEANTELMGELTEDQRSKYETLVGDPINER